MNITVKKNNHEKIPKGCAWFLVVAGIVMGTVFSFGMHYWESSVTKDQAIYTEAVFSSYKTIYGRKNSVKEIKLNFNNHKPLFIDGVCCKQEVLDKLDMVEPGTVLQMYIHPNSSTVLDIHDGNYTILLFDDTVASLSNEVIGFFILGIFMYLSAVFGLIKLIRNETY